MIAQSINNGEHLSDGTLVALLDGQDAPEESMHLTQCVMCAEKQTALKQASDVLRASLMPVPIPTLVMPKRPRTSRVTFSYPLAAAAVFLIASGAMATPVRNWIIRQLSSEKAPTPMVAPPPAVVEAPAGMKASFVPTDTLLTIQVESKQKTGSIEITVSSTDRVSVQVLAGAATEELVVLPGRLRIINSTASVANYRVTVPLGVRSAVVMIGNDRVASVAVDARLHRRISLK